MPSADQHRKKAATNRQFAATISLQDYPEWVVIALFYTAVHLVEQLRAAAGEGHSRGHDDRLAYILARHPAIHTAYTILQNASMLARYESSAAFFALYQRESIEERLLGKYLPEIEAYVQFHLPSRKTPSP